MIVIKFFSCKNLPQKSPAAAAGDFCGRKSIGKVPRTRIFVPGIFGPRTVTRIVTRYFQ